jgi:hypothetical protein
MASVLDTERRLSVRVPWRWPLFAFLLALTILKGIRMPSRWAVTHYLFTYQVGFTRRGLWGALLRLIFGSWTSSYFCLAAVGLAVFGAFLLFFVRLCRLVPEPGRAPLLLIVLSSPGLAYFAHLSGYLEQIIYLVLVAILIAARKRRARAVVTMSVLAAIVLPCIHEASILWVGGLTLLAVLTASSDGTHPIRSRVTGLAMVALVWIVATASVVTFGRLSHQKVDALRDDRLQMFEFRLRTDAFGTLNNTLGADLREMRARWADPNIRVDMALSVLVFAPTAIFLGVLAVRRGRTFDPNRTIQQFARVLVLGAILGPLLLHAMGRDEHRWNALATLNAGFAGLMLAGVPSARREAGGLARRPARVTGLALMVCIWGVTADPSFFDWYGPNHPPFSYGIQFLRDAIRAPDRSLWMPGAGR